MTATNRWSPVTIPAHDPVEPKILPPFEWEKSTFTPGLVVTELSPEDLSPEQHRALFGDDHDR